MVIERGHVLFKPGTDGVVLVHDNSGVTYRGMLGSQHAVGNILSIDVRYDFDPTRGTVNEAPKGVFNYKILRGPINPAEVRRAMNKLGIHKRLLSGLHWYEVHGD